MKVLLITLSLSLTSSFALAIGNSSSYSTSDSTSTTTYRSRPYTSADSILRTITPEIGLVISDTTSRLTTSKTGFTIGATMDLFNFSNVTFETGLLYKQEGGSVSTVYTPAGGTLTMNYLVVPLAAKYFFTGERTTGMYIKGGFAPSINVAHSYTTGDGSQTNDINGSNTFELGILGGVGGKIALSPDAALVLEGNYVRGVTNEIDSSIAHESVTNSSFSFISGVAVNL